MRNCTDRTKKAALLREAAGRELECSRRGLVLLPDELRREFARFRDGEFSDDDGHRAIALCFMAAMVEAGDA